MLPLTTALSGNSPISASAVTDLPQPDSPTRPSVSPRSSEKLTPRTASAGPRLVLSRTRKIVDFDQRRCCRSSPLPRQPRIEQIAQPVAQQIEAQHRDRDRNARIDREQRRLEQQASARR